MNSFSHAGPMLAVRATRSRRLLKCAAATLSALTCLIFAASAVAGPTVKVRVEEEGTTLLPQTTVTLNAPEPVSGCPANSVAAAINLAVGGNWDHGEAGGGGGDFTETILGQTESFGPESETWAEWVDYKWGGGICTDLLSEGDEVLMISDREPPPFAPTVLPLIVTEAPQSVGVGEPFAVKVDAVRTPAGTFAEPGQGTPEPVGGVTVSGGGASATTAANGIATLTLPAAGTTTLKASGAGFVASLPFSVCAHAAADGNCGTTVPAAPPIAAPYKGPFALVPKTTSLLDGHVYTGSAARLIAGQVLAHSAVSSVSLELRRSRHGRCWSYDGARERFVKAPCGSGQPFSVGASASYSYLLPAKLSPGRYVLDITAKDVAGNTTTLARGTSRIVFFVR
jgi:hypothetical protein